MHLSTPVFALLAHTLSDLSQVRSSPSLWCVCVCTNGVSVTTECNSTECWCVGVYACWFVEESAVSRLQHHAYILPRTRACVCSRHLRGSTYMCVLVFQCVVCMHVCTRKSSVRAPVFGAHFFSLQTCSHWLFKCVYICVQMFRTVACCEPLSCFLSQLIYGCATSNVLTVNKCDFTAFHVAYAMLCFFMHVFAQ